MKRPSIRPRDIIHSDARGFARYSAATRHQLALLGREAARHVDWRKLDSRTGREAAEKRWRRDGSRIRASFQGFSRGGFLGFLSNPFCSPQIYMRYEEARTMMGVSRDVFWRWLREGKLRVKQVRGWRFVEVSSMKRQRLTMRQKFNSLLY